MKERIIGALKSADRPVSGQHLADELGVSRAALWKQVEGLRAIGYVIDGSPRVGYTLASEPDRLFTPLVEEGLPTEFAGNVVVLDHVDSTNTLAKEMASREEMKPAGLVVAESQGAGRGRFGRHWRSPPGGIWCSLVLWPKIAAQDAGALPLLASVVVAEAVAEATGVDIRIKWPNDLLINDRKVAGILTEMAAEMGEVDYLVVGIGLNANLTFTDLGEPDLNATTLLDEIGASVDRHRLITDIVNRLWGDLPELTRLSSVLDRWRARSATLGRSVTVMSGGGQFSGIAIDLNEDGGLIVEDGAGVRRVFRSGEVDWWD
jgi:BirA family biotin operon repressor/biotin-[acetyl-CoA-carboxylase] ligase